MQRVAVLRLKLVSHQQANVAESLSRANDFLTALSISFCRAIKLRSRDTLPCEELRSSVAGSPIKVFSLAPSLHTALRHHHIQSSSAPLAAELGWTGDTVARHHAMAPLLFKDMRSLSCSSPASTAICPSLERQPIFRPQKAGASPLFQVPAEPRAHRQDGRKGQQHHHHRAAVGNGELVSPAGSTRFLLSGCAAGADEIQEVATAPVAATAAAPGDDVRREEPAAAADVKNTNTTQEQVVVLKVSLHCKACAGKVKKHLAKMEGVRTFSIDFTAKKVTVVGDVTPLGVLASVSKVKNAQIWAAPTPPQPAMAA